mgnify:FL=1
MECPQEFFRWSGELDYSDCGATEKNGVIFVGDITDLVCVGDLPACVKVGENYVEFSSVRAGVRVSAWEVAGALYGLLKSGFRRPQYYVLHFLTGGHRKEEDLTLHLPQPHAVVHAKPKGFDYHGNEALARLGDEALRSTGFPYGLVYPSLKRALNLAKLGRLRLTSSGLYGDALVYKGAVVLLSFDLEELKRRARLLIP